ncbi:hypothetical protein MLD38_003082 [Melastoma candidum]|uniref:Uncharacterized protein n=1 Tax=Melastoma candidum TaxID=119954 RepID=A0ACB9S2S7_9MYRT|nr:hypothetical protein MLD38_003082 [Melastoma candidum]
MLMDRKSVVPEEDGDLKGKELPGLVIEYEEKDGNDGFDKVVGKGMNAAPVLGVGSLTVTRLLTVDHEYWQLQKRIMRLRPSLRCLDD